MKLVTWAGASLIVALTQFAGAQTYPNRPLRLIVPFPPGGTGEVVSSTFAAKLSQSLGQTVVVQNRPGVTGVGANAHAAGTEFASKATPDGYNLLLGTQAAMSIAPALGLKLTYDPFRDFAPIGGIAFFNYILLAHPSLPGESVKELVELAKRKPGQLVYGSPGHGLSGHLVMEWFKSATGINVKHVPFIGGAGAYPALFAGEISLYFAGLPAGLPHVNAGRVKGIAVTGARRSSIAPQIPTISESGVRGFEYVAWYALFVPAKPPKEIIEKLHTEVVRTLRDPETVRQLTSRGAEPFPSSPAVLAKYVLEDQERWKNVVNTAGIKVN